MPNMSVWAIRLSLLYFVVGTTVGGLLLAGKTLPLPPWLWTLRPLHIEALLFGFMVQFVFGVGFWILPRTRTQVSKRAGDRPVVLALVLLNAGVWLVAGAAAWGGLAVAGRACEAAAAAAFAVHVWPRVRAAKH